MCDSSDCESYLTQEPEYECVICYEESLSAEACETCQHAVCDSCFTKLMETPNFRCPMCRTTYKHIDSNEVCQKLAQYYTIIEIIDVALMCIMDESNGMPNFEQGQKILKMLDAISKYQDKINTLMTNCVGIVSNPLNQPL